MKSLTDARLLYFVAAPAKCGGCGYRRAYAFYSFGDRAEAVCEPCKEKI